MMDSKYKVSKVVTFWTHLLVSTIALKIFSISINDILDLKLPAFAFLVATLPSSELTITKKPPHY